MTKFERVRAVEYYLDSGLQKSAPLTDEGNIIVDFDRTVSGESNVKEYWIQNNTPAIITLKSFSMDEDLHIDHPETLRSGESDKVTISFTPPKGRLKPLDARWGFEVLIG